MVVTPQKQFTTAVLMVKSVAIMMQLKIWPDLQASISLFAMDIFDKRDHPYELQIEITAWELHHV